MASTETASRLTAAHRRGQLAVRSRVIADALAIWPALDPTDLRATWGPVEAGLTAVVEAHATTSAGLAADYYERFRDAEGVAGAAPVRVAGVAHAEAVAAVRATGLRSALAAADGLTTAAHAFTRVVGAMTRVTLNAGRSTVLGSVEADDRAVGYARVTGGRPCPFCAMLASRGPVYKSRASALGSSGRRYHDHCSCSTEPVFHRDAPWPGRGAELAELWARSKSEHPGDADAARAAFASAVTARPA